MGRSRYHIILIAAWLFGTLFLVDTQGKARAGELIEALAIHKNGHYDFTIIMLVDAPRDFIYRLLTDYDNLTQLSPNIVSSHLLKSGNDEHSLVEINSYHCIAWFCRRMHQIQKVQDLGDGILRTTDVPQKGHVLAANSLWRIHRQGDKTRIEYHSTLQIDFWVPPLLGPMLLKNKFRSSLIDTINRLETMANPDQAD